MIKHLLPQRQRYFKTALHVHTDVSDGFWSPEELKACFKEHGFSCVAFSDHNLITDQSQLNDEDFLTLTSYEMGFQEEGNGWYARNVHVNVLAKEPGHLWQAGKPPKLYKNSPQYLDKVEIVDKEYPYSMESINDFIAQSNKHGFLCTYNHPMNNMMYRDEDMVLDGFWGIEVFNNDANLCGHTYYCDEKFQKFLMYGKRVFPIISDDCHSQKSFRGCAVWVGARALTYEAMIEALENGDFYATNGPQIHSLYIDENRVLHISCTEAMSVGLCSHCNFNKMMPPHGKGSPITQAKIDLNPWFDSITEESRKNAFFRLVVIDPQGNRAYTRPYWLDEL